MGDETFCLVPRPLSLSMRIYTQRKAGRRKRASTSLVPPSHCDSSPVTGVSRSPLCEISTKHLRRRKISAHHLALDRRDMNQCVVAEFYPWIKFYFPLLQNHTPSPPPPPPNTHTHPKKKEREKKISTKDKIEPQKIHL